MVGTAVNLSSIHIGSGAGVPPGIAIFGAWKRRSIEKQRWNLM